MVKDATADYSDTEMHAALEVNLPNYASAILTTDEIVTAITALAGVEVAAPALIWRSKCNQQPKSLPTI